MLKINNAKSRNGTIGDFAVSLVPLATGSQWYHWRLAANDIIGIVNLAVFLRPQNGVRQGDAASSIALCLSNVA